MTSDPKAEALEITKLLDSYVDVHRWAREFIDAAASLRAHPLRDTHTNDVPILMAQFAQTRCRSLARRLLHSLATAEAEREQLTHENNILRGLVQRNPDWKCPHGMNVDHIGKCPLGFPGCNCADDELAVMCDECEGITVRIQARAQRLESELAITKGERDEANDIIEQGKSYCRRLESDLAAERAKEEALREELSKLKSDHKQLLSAWKEGVEIDLDR